MELDKIRECKNIAEKAIETIIAEYEIQTNTRVHTVELNEDIIRMAGADKHYRNIKLGVAL